MQKNIVECPVCKALVFDKNDFPGSYVICTFCGWEDDNLQYYDPNYKGGANNVSLNEARENFKKFGVSDPEII
jgi:hypothetical protein